MQYIGLSPTVTRRMLPSSVLPEGGVLDFFPRGTRVIFTSGYSSGWGATFQLPG